MSCCETKLEYLNETKQMFRNAIDPDGTQITDETSFRNYINFIVTSTGFTNTSTVSATSINLGSTVTLKGSAIKGATPYQYAFYYKKINDSTWTVIKEFSTTATTTVKPTNADKYDVCIKIKDANTKTVNKYFTVNVT